METLSKTIIVTCLSSLCSKSRITRCVIFITLLFISGIVITSCNKPTQETAPVLHRLLLFKYKPEITQTQIDEAIQTFYGLKEKVPGMLDVVFAKAENFNREKQFTHVLKLSFSSEEAMKAYEEHPDHKAISKTGMAMLETFFMMDYWTGRD